ncbi:flagellar export protein FliJ [Propionispira raffinosivorans]|uniref:flagellar export protein FliJ n=1 Tax=Propionispira raffinosivorans TaxID=86959 RepID=UPI00036DEEAF|nr:flagellar export protein FliJ [Propionispira raffinosivorans]
MKKFKFQLAALLKVTKMNKDKSEVKLAQATQHLINQKNALTNLEKEMQAGLQEYEVMTARTKINITVLTTYSSFFAWKRSQIEQQKQAIIKAAQERMQRLEELKIVMNKLKSIEQLRGKRFDEFKQQALAEEQKQLDEIGLQIYTRAAK